MPLLMFLLNLVPLTLGYLLKILVFGLRGFWTPYIQGAKEAFAALPKVKKPKFRLKNLPNYVLIEFWLIADVFRYIDYRVRRALHIR
jgi:hypothetical protein